MTIGRRLYGPKQVHFRDQEQGEHRADKAAPMFLPFPERFGPLFRRQRGGMHAIGSRGNAGDPTMSRPPWPGDALYKGNRKGRRPVVGSRMGSW